MSSLITTNTTTEEIVILGSGTGIPSLKRGPAGILMRVAGQTVLIDTGPGTLHKLLTLGITYADIDKVLKEIEGQYREFFDEYFFDYIIEEIAVPFSFLYQPGKESMIYRSAREKTEKTSLTELELRVLKELAKNARCSISEVAEKLKISRELIKYHLKKLEKSEVILKYRPDTLPKKLGYNWHFLILKTEKLEGNINKSLTTFLLNHPNVTYFYRTAGSSDIQVELRTKTNEKLNEILMEIRGILKTVLKRFELLVILDELKYTYFPECLLEAKGKS